MLRLTALLFWAGALLYAQTPAPSGGKLDFVAGDAASNSFKPIPGVALTVVGPNGRTYSGVTGADAHFRLSDLPEGQYSIRDIQAKGFAVGVGGHPDTSYIPAGNTWVVNVPMHPVAAVEGTVTGDDGKPVAGATVYLEVYANRVGNQPEFKGIMTTTQTDAQGRYRLEESRQAFQSGYLPGNRFAVAAAFPGDDSPSAYSSDFIEFRNGQTSFAHLRLSAAQKNQQ